MANSASIDALRPEIWQKELFQDVIDGMYFTKNGLMGTGDNNIVQVFSDLKKGKGDTVTVPLTLKLNGSGVTGDNELEGNEEAITPYAEQVAIDQIRNAVRLTGKLDSQKNAYDMRMDAKNKLAIWAQEFLERQIFMKLGGLSTLTCTDQTGTTYSARATWSNTPDAIPSTAETSTAMAYMYTNRYLCADKTGGLNGIAATDILTTSLISEIKSIAKLVSPQVIPLRVDGQTYYIMFIHPKQALDLKTSASTTSNTWAQAQREAEIRGSKNPMFTGALGIWDGVALYEHEYVPTVLGTATFSSGGSAVASTVRAYRALLCGRQAAVAAFTTDSFNMVEKEFDYENQVGYATGIIGGVQKTQFNSKNYGVVTLDTGATQ